jgi:hypothetical protein
MCNPGMSRKIAQGIFLSSQYSMVPSYHTRAYKWLGNKPHSFDSLNLIWKLKMITPLDCILGFLQGLSRCRRGVQEGSQFCFGRYIIFLIKLKYFSF